VKKIVAGVLAAVVLVWGVALFEFEASPAPPHPVDAAPPVPEPPEPTREDDDSLPDAGLPEATELTVKSGFRDPEFQHMAKQFVTEPRDDPWASEEEHRLHDVLDAAGWHDAGRAHCRKTVCRIDLPGASPADLEALLATPNGRHLELGANRSYEVDNGAIQAYTYRKPPVGDTR